MGCCESKTDYGSNMGRKPKNNLHHKQEPSDHQPNNQDKIHFDEKQDNNHKLSTWSDNGSMKTITAINYIMKELKVSEEVARKLVDRQNVDGDEDVEDEELRKLWKDILIAKNEIYPLFAEVDTDGNGYVSQGQAVEVFKKMFPDIPEIKLKSWAEQYDTDKNDKVQYGEFVVLYCNIEAKKEQLAKRVDELNKNKDGLISEEEVKKELIRECELKDDQADTAISIFNVYAKPGYRHLYRHLHKKALTK